MGRLCEGRAQDSGGLPVWRADTNQRWAAFVEGVRWETTWLAYRREGWRLIRRSTQYRRRGNIDSLSFISFLYRYLLKLFVWIICIKCQASVVLFSTRTRHRTPSRNRYMVTPTWSIRQRVLCLVLWWTVPTLASVWVRLAWSISVIAFFFHLVYLVWLVSFSYRVGAPRSSAVAVSRAFRNHILPLCWRCISRPWWR